MSATQTLWTKTEVTRRLRVAAGMAKKADYLRKNALTELGLRGVPVHKIGSIPTRGEAFPEGDDLMEYLRLKDIKVEYAQDDEYGYNQMFIPGYVAHLYFTHLDFEGYGELVNVITVWLGDENHEPQLVSVPGRDQDRIDRINQEVL